MAPVENSPLQDCLTSAICAEYTADWSVTDPKVGTSPVESKNEDWCSPALRSNTVECQLNKVMAMVCRTKSVKERK